MITVDVTKLSCEFITQVINYLTQAKYVVDPCQDEVLYYFSKYKLGTSLADCLTHEDKCDLQNVTDTIIVPENTCTSIVSCADAATINLSKTSKACSYTVSLQNMNGIASAFPIVELQNDSVYHPAFLQVKAVGCGNTYTNTVSTGCLYNGSAIECDDTYKTHIDINYRLQGLPQHTSGYIKTLRVYKTTTSGFLDPVPIDLNLAPSNLAAWVGCGLCSGVTGSQLAFGHSNWANAFNTLLENVSYTLFGSLNSIITPSISTSRITLANKVKHNPAEEWLGINKLDFYLQWVDNKGVTNTITNPSITYSGQFSFMAENFSITTPCGNITGLAITTGGNVAGIVTGSNFNLLVLADPTLDRAAEIYNLSSPTCTITTLSAAYTANSATVITEWTDDTDTVISNALSVEVVDSGDYTFTVELESSCLADETITV